MEIINVLIKSSSQRSIYIIIGKMNITKLDRNYYIMYIDSIIGFYFRDVGQIRPVETTDHPWNHLDISDAFKNWQVISNVQLKNSDFLNV